MKPERTTQQQNNWIMELLNESASGLVDTDHSWHAQALCSGVGANLFFIERGESVHTVAEAKKICAQCPVQQRCLEYAVNNSEAYGIWGGKTPDERRMTGLFSFRPPSTERQDMVKMLRRLREEGSTSAYKTTAEHFGVSKATIQRAYDAVRKWEHITGRDNHERNE